VAQEVSKIGDQARFGLVGRDFLELAERLFVHVGSSLSRLAEVAARIDGQRFRRPIAILRRAGEAFECISAKEPEHNGERGEQSVEQDA